MDARRQVERDARRTRLRLLEAAFEEIHRRGYQAASLSDILARTGVTKGALYHHFPNKLALGYAVVEEILRERTLVRWVRPLEATDDPIDGLLQTLQEAKQRDLEEFMALGCPLNNLAQEMAPIDEGFRLRLEAIYQTWRTGIEAALRRGQANGCVRRDIDPAQTAVLIVAAFEGSMSQIKNACDRRLLHQCESALRNLLNGFRAE